MSKIAVITGSSRGIGRNTAISIARHGGDAILTYQNRSEDAQSAVAEIQDLGRKAIALHLNTGDISSFPPFVEQLKQALRETWERDTFDHLVNNAGYGDYALIKDTTEAQFDGLVNVHLKGVFFLAQSLLPLIADGGRIINVSSGLTRITFPGSAAYAAVQGAVEVLTRYMAKELGSRGITVNSVAPGAIETDFGGGRLRDNPDVKKNGGGYDRSGPHRGSRRYRTDDCQSPLRRQRLGYRTTDRSIRRAKHLSECFNAHKAAIKTNQQSFTHDCPVQHTRPNMLD